MEVTVNDSTTCIVDQPEKNDEMTSDDNKKAADNLSKMIKDLNTANNNDAKNKVEVHDPMSVGDGHPSHQRENTPLPQEIVDINVERDKNEELTESNDDMNIEYNHEQEEQANDIQSAAVNTSNVDPPEKNVVMSTEDNHEQEVQSNTIRLAAAITSTMNEDM